MKATYDANRSADLELISDVETSLATLRSSHNGKIASLETRASNLEASVVMKAEYGAKIAAIETKANSLESSISANADAIALRATRASLNAAILTINDRIKIVEDDISGIDELIARKISAADIDVTKLTSKTLRVSGLTADNLYATNTIYATHGTGGGRKEGAKAIRLADMAGIVDADCYVHSHSHLPMIMKQSFFRVDIQNRQARAVDKLFVNDAAALNYGGYGQSYEFKPMSRKSPVIHLSGTEKNLTATL